MKSCSSTQRRANARRSPAVSAPRTISSLCSTTATAILRVAGLSGVHAARHDDEAPVARHRGIVDPPHRRVAERTEQARPRRQSPIVRTAAPSTPTNTAAGSVTPASVGDHRPIIQSRYARTSRPAPTTIHSRRRATLDPDAKTSLLVGVDRLPGWVRATVMSAILRWRRQKVRLTVG